MKSLAQVITLFGGFGSLKIVGMASHFNLIQPSILFLSNWFSSK
jgi:hypothetical protein